MAVYRSVTVEVFGRFALARETNTETVVGTEIQGSSGIVKVAEYPQVF